MSTTPRDFLNARSALCCGLAIIVMSVASLAVHEIVLEGIPHVSDEIVYLFQAKILVRENLVAPSPPLPDSFRYLNIIIDEERSVWFGIYPPGWPLALAVFLTAGIPLHANIAINGLALLLVFGLCSQLFGRAIASGTLVLAALSPFVWVMGATLLSHPLSLILIAISLWALAHALREDSPKPLLMAAAACAVLLLTRPLDAAVTIVTISLFALVRKWFAGLFSFLLIVSFSGVLLLLYNHALTGDSLLFPQTLYDSRDSPGFGPAYGKIETYGSFGHTPLKAVANLGLNIKALSTNLFGWPYLSLLFVPFALLERDRQKRAGLILLGLYSLLFCAAYMFYWYDGIMYGARFYYPLLPMLLGFTAIGMVNLYRLARGYRREKILIAVISLCFLFSAFIYIPHYFSTLGSSLNNIDDTVFQTASRSGIESGVMLCPPALRGYPSYGSVFWRNSPWLDTDIIWARDLIGTAGDLKAAFPDKTLFRFCSERGTGSCPQKTGPHYDHFYIVE